MLLAGSSKRHQACRDWTQRVELQRLKQISFTCFVSIAVRAQHLSFSDFALLQVSCCLWDDLPTYSLLCSPALQTQSVEWTEKNVDFPFPWWTISAFIKRQGAYSVSGIGKDGLVFKYSRSSSTVFSVIFNQLKFFAGMPLSSVDGSQRTICPEVSCFNNLIQEQSGRRKL